jgi:hypothetical protein
VKKRGQRTFSLFLIEKERCPFFFASILSGLGFRGALGPYALEGGGNDNLRILPAMHQGLESERIIILVRV